MTAEPKSSLIRVGVFVCREDAHDALWNQCNESGGRDGNLLFCGPDASADHVLCINIPVPRKDGSSKAKRGLAGAFKARPSRAERYAACFRRIGRDPKDITVLFYEPPELVRDLQYDVARQFAARVYGPDERATHRVTLPTMWRAPLKPQAMLGLTREGMEHGLTVVTSGKEQIAGHRNRMQFLRRLRAANVPMNIYGAGIPNELGGLGFVKSKHNILRTRRFTLAIENEASTQGYVTEKLWDALLAWSLPLYYGSATADSMIPRDAFVRLPDLEAAGVETVKRVLANPEIYEQHVAAMTEARKQIVGPLRMVEWVRHEVLGNQTT